jgi:hypothetical protein
VAVAVAAKARELIVRQENASGGTEIDVIQGKARECTGGVGKERTATEGKRKHMKGM